MKRVKYKKLNITHLDQLWIGRVLYDQYLNRYVQVYYVPNPKTDLNKKELFIVVKYRYLDFWGGFSDEFDKFPIELSADGRIFIYGNSYYSKPILSEVLNSTYCAISF